MNLIKPLLIRLPLSSRVAGAEGGGDAVSRYILRWTCRWRQCLTHPASALYKTIGRTLLTLPPFTSSLTTTSGRPKSFYIQYKSDYPIVRTESGRNTLTEKYFSRQFHTNYCRPIGLKLPLKYLHSAVLPLIDSTSLLCPFRNSFVGKELLETSRRMVHFTDHDVKANVKVNKESRVQ